MEIAAIANSFGRSLAISGSRGLCVLDIHRDDASIVNASLGSQSPSSLLQLPTSCHEGFECRKDTFQLRTKQDRWRMFSRQEEISFAVKAVTWWEDATDRCEDTIVAVIQYVESFDPSYYIVAWSSRRQVRYYNYLSLPSSCPLHAHIFLLIFSSTALEWETFNC